jgi:predicted  nucleic acid-binding Zn-ribbon protein
MTEQAAPRDPSAEEQTKRLRSRKVYIQLRIPRVKAEIAAVATRKKAMNEPGSEASKELIEERIYSNQHLVALRKELESLEQESKTVLQSLREIRTKETGKPMDVGNEGP